MEKNIEIGTLYQYYKDLLSEKQAEAIEQYYLEDLSLTEIAEITGVSKQAVSTNIKRAEKLLEDYENSLKVYEKLVYLVDSLEDLSKFLEGKTDKNTYEIVNEKISDIISNMN
ncbi:MAG: DNA-binding protein [Tissierellia bacterium]|nr:DNA-binding protein [Tissierellia bacterium]